MSIQAFNKLVRMLGDSRGVQRDFRKSRHGGFVPPEIVVGCGIQYLTGDKYTTLTDVFGVSKSEVYVVERCDDVLFSITPNIVSLILVINSTTTNIIIATNIIFLSTRQFFFAHGIVVEPSSIISNFISYMIQLYAH